MLTTTFAIKEAFALLASPIANVPPETVTPPLTMLFEALRVVVPLCEPLMTNLTLSVDVTGALKEMLLLFAFTVTEFPDKYTGALITTLEFEKSDPEFRAMTLALVKSARFNEALEMLDPTLKLQQPVQELSA